MFIVLRLAQTVVGIKETDMGALFIFAYVMPLPKGSKVLYVMTTTNFRKYESFFFFLKEPCLGTETGQKLNVDLGVFYIDNNYDQGELITDFNLDSKQLEKSRP